MQLSRIVLIGMLGAIGCGDDAAPTPPPSTSRDAGRDATAPADGAMEDAAVLDAEMDASAGCNGAGSPQVMFLSPTAASDPNSDAIVTADQLVVQCAITASEDPEATAINPESVEIRRLNAAGAVVDTPPAVASGEGLYEATFNLSEVDNGELRFECFAADSAEEPQCGSAELTTLLDLGPLVAITAPMDMSVHSQTMLVTYMASALPLTDGDTEAGVASHSLEVAGVEISNVMETSPGNYQATIDLEDNTVFGAPLNGAYEIRVSATNMRTPTAVSRSATITFTADSEGPEISFLTPSSGELVGGLTQVDVEILDDVGVLESSVSLRVGMTTVPLRNEENDTYSGLFDASQFPSTITELTLQVTASDLAGNSNTTSEPVKLDSVPPIASLDPPQVREARMQSGMLQCSTLFDPVGSDSIDDGETAGTQAEFRARINDLGNSSFGADGTVAFLAGVESTGAAEIVLLDDHTMALLVDTTGDGVCDSINPDIEPTSGNPNSALVIELSGVRPTGQSFYHSMDAPTTPGMPSEYYGTVYDGCVPGLDSTAPMNLCDSVQASRVIYPTVPNDHAIFARPPILNTTTCVGDAFDFQASLSEGWACAAVRVTDRLGNTGVSPALRVCFDDGVAPAAACPVPVGSIADESARPDCNPGCTPPQSFHNAPGWQLIGPP